MKRTQTSTIKPTTPIRAIRSYCLDCAGGDKAEVRSCSFESCPFYPYRMGKRPPKGTTSTPMKTIRAQCLECCSGSFVEVRRCPADACPVYSYRLGRKVELETTFSSLNAFLSGCEGNGIGGAPNEFSVAIKEGVCNGEKEKA